MLKRYLKVTKDQSQIGGDGGSILNNIRLESSTVTSRIDTNGTNTGRFTSSKINLAQIPSQKEFRQLFNAPVYYHIPEELYKEILQYVDL
jgi:hypothetical protein